MYFSIDRTNGVPRQISFKTGVALATHFYQKAHYAGVILAIDYKENEVQIKSMERGRFLSYRFPVCNDIIWYKYTDIVEKIKIPNFFSKGWALIQEIAKYLPNVIVWIKD